MDIYYLSSISVCSAKCYILDCSIKMCSPREGLLAAAVYSGCLGKIDFMPLKTIKLSAEIASQSGLETLLVEISTLFIDLPAEQIDGMIGSAQRRICEFLDLDRSTLWQFEEHDPGMLLLTNVYQPPETKPAPDRLTVNDSFPWVYQKLIAGETIVITKMTDLPVEAERDRESFRLYGAKSGCYVPLSVGQGPVFGALAFAVMRREKNWLDAELKGCMLLAQVFANALARKKTEQVLREREANLVLTTNAAGAGLWNMDIDIGSVWGSEKLRELFDFDPDEQLTDESFYNKIHPDDRERVIQVVQQAILTGEGFSCEYRIILPNGKIRWIAVRGQRHTESGSNPGRLLGVATDITAHKQLELEREERLQFEKLLVDISSRFVNLPADRLDAVLEDALQRIAALLNLDFVALWQSLAENGESPIVYKLTHMYPSDGDLKSSDLTEEQLPWFKQQMLAGKIAGFSSLEELPPEAAQDREFARQLGIKSNLCIPLTVGGAPPIGLIGFNTIQAERNWPKELVERLQLVTEIFTNALERRRMDGQLQDNLREIESFKQRLERENVYLQKEVKTLAEHSEILGQSTAIKSILLQARQVAATDSTVLLLGETGTGKELLARAIHGMSLRKDRPLVTINCASLPPSLIENELFGREKGAYTGAMTKMTGRFELADGSTLFLDEIGELPLNLQSKLLRVLEEGTLERLGSTKPLHVDARIIAATNRDIEKEVADGKFRQDLFYRLNVFPILIPPLRERSEDIPLLTWEFVREFQKKQGKQIDKIPRETLEAMLAYTWPGNVRELRNVIERAVILSMGRTLEVQMPHSIASEKDTTGTFEDIVRRELLAVLKKTNWRVTGHNGAAEILGLNKSTLYSKMKKLGIRRDCP